MAVSPSVRRFRAGLCGVAILAGVSYAVFIMPKPVDPASPGTAEVAKETPAKVAIERKVEATPVVKDDPLAGANLQDSATLAPCAVEENLDVEPTADGWETEVLNDLAGAQLKKLGALLVAPEKIISATLPALVEEDFACEPLVPENLVVVYKDKSFVVSRPKETTADGALPHKGAAGLAAALGKLAALAEGSRDIHTKFKVYRVEKPADGGTAPIITSAYFQTGGRTKSGSVQVGATWICEWVADDAAKPKSVRLRSIRVAEYEQTKGTIASGPMFADCTEAILGESPAYQDQLRYSVDHWLARLETKHGLDIGGWEGLAVGDINGDGLDDLYVCQSGLLVNRMFMQMQDGTAVDVTADAGVDILNQSMSALFADFDNDGDQDLAVGTELGVIFLANDGDGKFMERPPQNAARPGQAVDRRMRPAIKATRFMPDASPYSLSAADYDGDGDLDLFVCGYRKRPGPGETLEGWARPIPYHDANNGGRNTLLRNDGSKENGQWKFTYATVESGLDENNRKFSYAASWEDFDNDGDLDLHVANDFGRDNLYQNDGRGHFRDIAAKAGADDIGAGMSSAWGDYDNDGWMDLYISNMFSSAGNRVAFNDKFQPTLDPALRASFQHHARGNTLLRNRGDGTFQDVSTASHVTVGRWAWASKLADMNNDGWEDILVTNGFVAQEDPADL